MGLGNKIARVAAPFWQFYVDQMSKMLDSKLAGLAERVALSVRDNASENNFFEQGMPTAQLNHSGNEFMALQRRRSYELVWGQRSSNGGQEYA